jgi:hypothetical protein
MLRACSRHSTSARPWEISRDLHELTLYGPLGYAILAAIAGLPTASILVLAWRRRLLALVPLAISALLFAVWALYYATDWWANPGLGGGAFPALLVALGWLVLIVAALPRPRWWGEV